MHRNKVIRYLQSIIAIPMLAVSIPLSGTTIPGLAEVNSVLTSENSVITTQEEVAQKEKADAIDAYFKAKGAPLEGYGMKFVLEAEKNNIDWRLLPAIAMRESTGGKHACKRVPNSVFGWGSCKISFESIDKSIEIVSSHLGGNNDNTDHHYNGKTTLQILKKYNSVIPTYSKEIVKIMKSIRDDGQPII